MVVFQKVGPIKSNEYKMRLEKRGIKPKSVVVNSLNCNIGL